MEYKQQIEKIKDKICAHPEDFAYYNALYCICEAIDNKKEKYKATTLLKRICRAGVTQKVSIENQLNHLYMETLLMEARFQRFDSYMQYIELNREPEKRFWLPRRKQLLPVANAIQDLIDDELDILTISLPPGTGKSTLEIFLHSMMIGAFPDHPSLASGHSSKLTDHIYDGVLGIINDPDYLWHEIYPEAGTVITDAKDGTIDLGKKHPFPSLTCRSIDGSLTGATRCEKLLTADDLVTGIEEAMSPSRLESLWNKYTNDLKSRKKLGCKELHLATRWSVHDVIGRLGRQYEDDDRVRFLVMPATNESGESNFNYQYGVGFDTKYFEDMKSNLDDASYRALFMNEPIEREGQLYPVEELRRYFDLPSKDPDAIISVCDTKDRGDDFAFMPVAYVYGDDYYIEDCVFDNRNIDIIEPRLVEMLMRHNVQMSRFESNSAGGQIAKNVQKAVKEKGGITNIQTKFSEANKETRIIVASPWVKQHCLFKAEPKNREYSDMLKALCGHTTSGKNKHDDVPDGMAMLSDYAQSFNKSKVEFIRCPF